VIVEKHSSVPLRNSFGWIETGRDLLVLEMENSHTFDLMIHTYTQTSKQQTFQIRQEFSISKLESYMNLTRSISLPYSALPITAFLQSSNSGTISVHSLN
jgi:hypothetical protein